MSSSNPDSSYSQSEQTCLLQIARTSIINGIDDGKPCPVDTATYPESLQQARATFITLKINDELRGCIGSLTAREALVESVAHNAYAAAFEDPRFARLTKAELDTLSISISVLTPAEPLEFTSEEDLISKIRPGIDGLILKDGFHKGTFLPSVWESLPEASTFLQHLKLKAGLEPHYWSDTINIERYTAEVIQ